MSGGLTLRLLDALHHPTSVEGVEALLDVIDLSQLPTPEYRVLRRTLQKIYPLPLRLEPGYAYVLRGTGANEGQSAVSIAEPCSDYAVLFRFYNKKHRVWRQTLATRGAHNDPPLTGWKVVDDG